MYEDTVIRNERDLHVVANQLIEELYIVLNYISSKKYKMGGLNQQEIEALKNAENLFITLKVFLNSPDLNKVPTE